MPSIHIHIVHSQEIHMAKTDVNGMSYAELIELETKLASLKAEKQSQERASIKEKLTAIAKQAGFDIHDLFGRGRGGKGGKVAPKYRNPKNPAETWTGRGRMPRWMAAATKGNKAKREEFLIK
jgi:DNA-binding protein H-NS